MNTLIERLSPRQRSWIAGGAVAIASLAAGFALARMGSEPITGEGHDTECKEVLYWYDPMAPEQHFDKPGKSPFMDMQLVPRCAGDKAASPGVQIDPSMAQNFGIRSAPVVKGVIEAEISVTGTLAYNQRQVAQVEPRSGGYVQRTYGLAPDDIVSRGTPLVDLLIPAWGGAQAEYLAVAGSGDIELTRAARERLRLLGMPQDVIDTVARTGRQHSTLTITAPLAGAITQLDVRPGMTVVAGQPLAEISGLDPIWLDAAVPEVFASAASVGRRANAAFTAFPGETFAGRIAAILPSAQTQSRTLTARIELPNPHLRLKPGMFAQVSLASERREALLVPSEAVIRTGNRALVMLKQEKGRYRPAEVRIGREAGGQSEILAGLSPGEEVVVSGQFLLDSEASLAGVDMRPLDVAGSGAGGRSDGDRGVTSHAASGTIQSISARSVTLRHGAVPTLDWPAMTMAFAIGNAQQLQGFKQGDRVRFQFIQAVAGPRIVNIEKIER